MRPTNEDAAGLDSTDKLKKKQKKQGGENEENVPDMTDRSRKNMERCGHRRTVITVISLVCYIHFYSKQQRH